MKVTPLGSELADNDTGQLKSDDDDDIPIVKACCWPWLIIIYEGWSACNVKPPVHVLCVDDVPLLLVEAVLYVGVIVTEPPHN